MNWLSPSKKKPTKWSPDLNIKTLGRDTPKTFYALNVWALRQSVGGGPVFL
ncbi:MAG: hypothetical protein VST68_04935 [Nitrospirota bacterium]|nr:hypothetical protein [Nitrospirota bacterium]